MKTIKKMPVTIPLNYDGSLSDVFQDFQNRMQEITGGRVDIACDLKGYLTIYFEGEKKPRKKSDSIKSLERLLNGTFPNN